MRLPLDEIVQGDCLEVMRGWPDESLHLVFADPPYNIGKAAWDRVDGYMAWCAEWIAECSRVLRRNGAFWISHSEPLVLADLSRLVEKHGRALLNWVTWDKTPWLYCRKYAEAGSRGFLPSGEYLIFHADEGDWTRQCDRDRGFIFEPLRAYLADEWRRAGLRFEQANEACGTASMAARHYFARSQWSLPTPDHYESLRRYANRNGGDYLRREHEDLRREHEDLRREYEDLRREYEDLRYTFNNPGKVSSVWQFGPAPANGHPTPKPEPLLERIIAATSNPGDVVLDPFVGSGTTVVAAQKLGRHFVGIEKEAEYVEISRRRVAHWAKQPALVAVDSSQ